MKPEGLAERHQTLSSISYKRKAVLEKTKIQDELTGRERKVTKLILEAVLLHSINTGSFLISIGERKVAD